MYDSLDLLQKVSRTFALSVRFLPANLRDPLGLAYLLLRVSDGIEDTADLDAERKVDLLRIWEEVLLGYRPADEFVQQIKALDTQDAEILVAQQADQMHLHLLSLPTELRETIATHVAQTTRGMARWQEQGPIVKTIDELDDYMFEVAGRVGYLVTEIFSWYSPVINRRKEFLLPLSRHSGLGLQTVNVIRGLRSDYERGWVFVPTSLLDHVGLTIDEFFIGDQEAKTLQVVEMLIWKAEGHLRHGLQYIQSFPKVLYRVRLACMWPLFFALATLSVSRDNLDVVQSEVKITREKVKAIMRKTSMFGWSNRWLRIYYHQLSAPFIGQAEVNRFDPVLPSFEDALKDF